MLLGCSTGHISIRCNVIRQSILLAISLFVLLPDDTWLEELQVFPHLSTSPQEMYDPPHSAVGRPEHQHSRPSFLTGWDSVLLFDGSE